MLHVTVLAFQLRHKYITVYKYIYRTYGCCVKTPILANIYETHRCLLNITSLMRYLVNIDPLLATSVRYLANVGSRYTDAMFNKHRLEMHGCDIW